MKRSLFLRLFLGLWAAVALLAAGLVATSPWFTRSRPGVERWQLGAERMLEHRVGEAAGRIVAGRQPEPREFPGRRRGMLEGRGLVPVHVLDPLAGTWAGPTPGEEIGEFARRVAADERPRSERIGVHHLAGRPVRAPDGRTLIVVAALRRPPELVDLLSPRALAGRLALLALLVALPSWWIARQIAAPVAGLRGDLVWTAEDASRSSRLAWSGAELYGLGLIDRLPSLAIIQAEGANPLYRSYERGLDGLEPVHAETVATAIKIGNPVNYAKAARALKWTEGVVEQVSDQEIMDAKALIDRQGIGCEPASACSLAGTAKLVHKGVIKPGETVVGILTGHILKDPEATIQYHNNTLADIQSAYPNQLFQAEPSVEAISRILETRQAALDRG